MRTWLPDPRTATADVKMVGTECFMHVAVGGLWQWTGCQKLSFPAGSSNNFIKKCLIVFCNHSSSNDQFQPAGIFAGGTKRHLDKAGRTTAVGASKNLRFSAGLGCEAGQAQTDGLLKWTTSSRHGVDYTWSFLSYARRSGTM